MKYYTQHRGVLTFTAGIVYGFVKTRPELAVPDVQYHFAHASYGSAQTRILEHEPGMTLTVYQCRPESKGSIHAKSADPAAAPAIRPNFLAEELDRQTWSAGMKIGRPIINNAVLDQYRAFEMNPGEKVQTDEQRLEFARLNGQTTYHVTGTCKMGHDPMAVVDDELRVHGIAGLRVVDASIMPTLVSGNTNAAVIMIAEKGADMIKDAHRGRWRRRPDKNSSPARRGGEDYYNAMRYISTRGQAPVLDFAGVLLAGLAEDGGLYVPKSWPRFSFADWRAMRGSIR